MKKFSNVTMNVSPLKNCPLLHVGTKTLESNSLMDAFVPSLVKIVPVRIYAG